MGDARVFRGHHLRTRTEARVIRGAHPVSTRSGKLEVGRECFEKLVCNRARIYVAVIPHGIKVCAADVVEDGGVIATTAFKTRTLLSPTSLISDAAAIPGFVP